MVFAVRNVSALLPVAGVVLLKLRIVYLHDIALASS